MLIELPAAETSIDMPLPQQYIETYLYFPYSQHQTESIFYCFI